MMNDLQQPQSPLNWEASATTTHPESSSTLPAEVEACLKNARFLHLATCDNSYPHVSLMNYTFLPSTPFTPSPSIIMTTNPSSKKTINLINNPHVSILVHDWVSHRPPTRAPPPDLTRQGSPPPEATRSSLASFLLNINTSALSSISATINGEARVVEHGSDEEIWCKEKHLENHNFTTTATTAATAATAATTTTAQARDRQQGGRWGERVTEAEGDGGTSCFIQGQDVRVVVVEVKQGRIADWKGGVKDWSLLVSSSSSSSSSEEEEEEEEEEVEEQQQWGRQKGGGVLINGIS